MVVDIAAAAVAVVAVAVVAVAVVAVAVVVAASSSYVVDVPFDVVVEDNMKHH